MLMQVSQGQGSKVKLGGACIWSKERGHPDDKDSKGEVGMCRDITILIQRIEQLEVSMFLQHLKLTPDVDGCI